MLEVALSHRYDDFALDIEFAAPGGVTALFGPSGAGKSSVVNAVAGLLRCRQARIVVNGRVLDGGGLSVPVHQRRIGMVFQEPRLFPHLSLRQNLTYGRWFAARRTRSLDDVVDLLALGPLMARRILQLSGGERQRLAIGRALLAEPDLLVLDEPLAALDEARKAEILPYLERLRDEALLPMLYVSHAQSEVARLATTIVVMAAGRVVRAGPVDTILADPVMAEAMGLRGAASIIAARMVAVEADGLCRLDTPGGPLFLAGIGAAPGRLLRLRVPAQDVILARNRPEGLSALNILAVTVVQVTAVSEAGGVLVQLRLGEALFLARITRRSAEALALAPGVTCFAILKSVALAQGDAERTTP